LNKEKVSMLTINWPWAIILCRYSDISNVPQQPQYYVDLYTQNGTGGIADYWRTVSSNALDLTGSQVWGWFTMNHTSSEIAGLTFPGDRWKLVQWGIDTAQANGVNLAPFKRVLVVQNFGPDHGAAGNGVVIVHTNPTLCEFGFICHEMGHGFGLPHSFSANPDTMYGDGWDLMSFATTTFQFPIAFQGTQGAATVGLNARNLEALGVIPPGRVWQPPSADFSASIALDPVNQPPLGNHGFLVAKIPPSATRPVRSSQSAYTVEFRHNAGWDQRIPEDAVIIHEVRTDGNSYLQPTMWGRYKEGDQFVTPDPKVFMRITTIGPFSAIDKSSTDMSPTAALRIWDLPEGCLRKEDSKPKVYLIENAAKRWVTSPAVLFALGKSWADVRSVPDGGLLTVPDGPDMQLLVISVTPHPVPTDRSVSVTVQAVDASTNADVQGEVYIDGVSVGATGVPFTHTFHVQRKRVPGSHPPEWDVTYPTGFVRAVGYPDAPLDLGFPDI
jgi:hypothetical protein